jgi:hypothetical protein
VFLICVCDTIASSSEDERLSGDDSMRWWTLAIDWMSEVSWAMRCLVPAMRDR